MNLVIDVGNSFMKLAVFQGSELLEKKVVSKENFEEEIQKIFQQHPKIDRKILSSVSGSKFLTPDFLQKDEKFIELNLETPLPFLNKYATPKSLGNDRKALVAAAAKYFKNSNVLVIDAGTCITYDFKNDKNEYLGGAISPGLNMRFKALHTFTANLPELIPTNEVELIGQSTAGSINSGVVHGLCCEIEGSILNYSERFKNLEIIFTGGDAQFLSKRLKNGIFANSNFLLEGLNYILEFNNTQ
ncbi:type III pantothenate kinase [Salinimicrobium sp. GXAS 041]|uniref:type III pantothenate kinase n=1 Tax=Salinimicrobium sp. GXAS 041 TaxID=3400806 RepID=UPI003C744A03